MGKAASEWVNPAQKLTRAAVRESRPVASPLQEKRPKAAAATEHALRSGFGRCLRCGASGNAREDVAGSTAMQAEGQAGWVSFELPKIGKGGSHFEFR